MKKDVIMIPYGTIIQRPGTKFACAIINDEIILFQQDGHIATNERVMEVQEENA